jgi:hypothetical protein
MRRIIFWAFLFLLGSGVLGATVFSGQIAGASGKKPAKRAAPAPTHVVVDNTPLPVSGTVNVGTMPNVKLDPTGNTVQVASSNANPVSITNINDGQSPFSDQRHLNLPPGSFGGCMSFAAPPAGQTLVVEMVSAHVILPTGTILDDARLFTAVGAHHTNIFLSPTKNGSTGSSDLYTVTQLTRVYDNDADPRGRAFCVDTASLLTDAGTLDATVDGYLVKTP